MCWKLFFLRPRNWRDTIQFSFGKQISWNISIPADSSHIHSSGVATPIAETWISSDVQHFMIAWIIACRGPLLWTLVINSWLILILSGWKRDRSNKPAKPAPKWSIATLIPAAFSDLTASANSSNRDMTSLSVNSTMICSGTRALAFISSSKKRLRQVC